MRFEWDEQKNEANRAKHGMDFSQALQIRALVFDADVREDYAEERWFGLGLVGDMVVGLVFTLPSEGVIRILSLRKATRDEEERYFREAFRK